MSRGSAPISLFSILDISTSLVPLLPPGPIGAINHSPLLSARGNVRFCHMDAGLSHVPCRFPCPVIAVGKLSRAAVKPHRPHLRQSMAHGSTAMPRNAGCWYSVVRLRGECRLILLTALLRTTGAISRVARALKRLDHRG